MCFYLCFWVKIRNATIGYAQRAASTSAEGEVSVGSGVPASSEGKKAKATVTVKEILKNMTLDIEQNSKVAILGRNGCGKR